MFEQEFAGSTNINQVGTVGAQLHPIATAATEAGDAPEPIKFDALKPAPGDIPAPEGNVYTDEEKKRVKGQYGDRWEKMSWFDQQRALAHDRWFRDVDTGAIDDDTFLDGIFNDPEVERINKREADFVSALKNALSKDVTRLTDDEAQGYFMDLVESDPRFGFKDDVDGSKMFGAEAEYGRGNLKRLLSIYSGANPNGLFSREAQKWMDATEEQKLAYAKRTRGVKESLFEMFDTDREIVESAEKRLMERERTVQFATLMAGLSPAGQEVVQAAIKADEMDERTLRFLPEDERDAAMAAFRVQKADLDANWWLTQGAYRAWETGGSMAKGTWRILSNVYLTTGGRNPVGSKQLAAYEKEQELQLKIEDAEKWKYRDNLTFAGDIASGLMGTIPYMVAMTNPYGGTLACLGMANDARERMILAGVDQDTALGISLPVGVIEGWIEKLQWDRAFGGSLSEFAIRRASLLATMKQIGKKPAAYLGGNLLKMGKETAVVTLTEDCEEVLQQLTEDLGVSLGRQDYNVREIVEDMWDTAVESFPTTLGFGLMRASGIAPAMHRRFSRRSVLQSDFVEFVQSKNAAMNVVEQVQGGGTAGQNVTTLGGEPAAKPVVKAKVEENGPDFPGETAQDAPETPSTPSAGKTTDEPSAKQDAQGEAKTALLEKVLDDFRIRWHRIDDAKGRIEMLADSGLNADQAAIVDEFFRLEDDFFEDNPFFSYIKNGERQNVFSIENLPQVMRGVKKVSRNEDGSYTLDLQLDADTVVPVKMERVDRSTLRDNNRDQFEKQVRMNYEKVHGEGSWDNLDEDERNLNLGLATPGGFTRITLGDTTVPYKAVIQLAAPDVERGDGGAELWEVGHEVFHAATLIGKQMGILTDEDIEKMRRVFGEAKGEGYLFDEEGAADAYGKFLIGRADDATGVFAKIRDFFRRIYNALNRKGGNEPAELNAANVFEAISSGNLRGISALSGITVNEAAQETAAQDAEANLEKAGESSTRNKPTATVDIPGAVTIEATVEEVPVENLSTKDDPDFSPELDAVPALVNSNPADGLPVVVGGGNVLSGSDIVDTARKSGAKSVKVKRVRKVKTARKPTAREVKPFDIFHPQESLAEMNPFERNRFLSVRRFCDIHEGAFPCLQYWLDHGHAMFARPAKGAKINDHLELLSKSDRLFLTGIGKGGAAWDELPSLIGMGERTTEEICDQALEERAKYISWKKNGGLTPDEARLRDDHDRFISEGHTEEEWAEQMKPAEETAEVEVGEIDDAAAAAELAELGYYSIRDVAQFLNDQVEADFVFNDTDRFAVPGSVAALADIANGKDRGIIHNAKYGDISYPLGTFGKVTGNGNIRHGLGLLHIVYARMAKDGASIDEAITTALKVAEAAEGGVASRDEKNRIWLDKDGVRAVIAKNSDGKKIITGYEIYAEGAEFTNRASSAPNDLPTPRSEDILSALKSRITKLSSTPRIMAQSGDTVKGATRFALKNAVERTKDLVAVHNMREDALAPTVGLGGFAIPSIAILKDSYGHNEFGEITVLFGKETIDPRKNRLNRIYSHDAWTATFPAVFNKIDTKAVESVTDALMKKIPESFRKDFSSEIHAPTYEDNINDTWKQAADADEAYGTSFPHKLAYLADNGEKVEPKMKSRNHLGRSSMRVQLLKEEGLRRVYDEMGKELIDIYLGPGSEAGDQYKKYERRVEQIARDVIWERDYEGKPDIVEGGFTKDQVMSHFFNSEDDRIGWSEMEDIAASCVRLQEDIEAGTLDKPVVDTWGTKNEIDKRVPDHDPGFVSWLKEKYGNPILGKGIYNGKERFTRMGNRRSFDAIHDPATLDNIVRAMRKTQQEQGNGIFGRNPFGLAAKGFSSLSELINNEGILRELTEEEEKKIKKGLSERLSEIVSRYEESKVSGEDNPFIRFGRAEEMMFDAYDTARGSFAGLKRELNAWGYTASDDLVEDFLSVMRDISVMPTNYFEAKPQRAVRFDEPKAWIVPDTAKPETLKLLSDIGQRVYTYKGGDNADRLRAVNRAADETDSRFSVANAGGQQKMSGIAYPDATVEIGSMPDRFSLGNRKREEFKSLIIRKRPDFKDPDKAVEEIGKFATPKEQKAALKWLIGGRLILPEDAPKVTEAIRYAEKAKKDPLQYDGPVELMNELAEFKPKDKPIDPDTVPELSDKREFTDGVVTYAVQDDRAGQEAMREIVNTHWGKNANPWCLLHGDGEGNLSDGSDGGYNAWEYWNHYNALPKRVAFRNGKLLAFMATETPFENIYGDSYVKDYFSRSSSYPKWIKDYHSAEYRYNGFEDYMWKKHPDEMRNEGFRVPEKWWDRNDEDHPGIPLGNQAVPNDPFGRFADFIIDKDGKRQVEGGYHKDDANVEIYWDSDGEINEYRDKKTDFRARYTFGNVESVVFRNGFEFHTSSAQFVGDGTDRIKELVIGGTVVFNDDGSFYYTAGFSSSYTFLNFKPDFTLDTSKDNAFDETVGTDGTVVTTEIAAKRIARGIVKSIEQAKAAYKEAVAIRDTYTANATGASPAELVPSETGISRGSVTFNRKDPTDIIAGIVAMKTRRGEKMTINAVQKLLASVGADPAVGADLILRGQKSANRIGNIVKGKALDDDTFLELATDEAKKSRMLSFAESMGMEGYRIGSEDERNLVSLNEAKAAAVAAAMESATGFAATKMEQKYGFNLVDSVANAHRAQVLKAKKPQDAQDKPGEVNGEGIGLSDLEAQEAAAQAAKPAEVAAPESAAMTELKAKAAKRADRIDSKYGLVGGMSPAQVSDAKYQEQLEEYRKAHPEEAGGGEGQEAPVKRTQVKREQLDFNRASDFLAFVEEVVARESGRDGLFAKKNGAYQCSPLDVRNLANTARFFLKKVASRLLYSRDRELIMRDLDGFAKITTLRGAESAIMNAYTRIQDRLIPETQEELIRKLEWAGRQIAEQGAFLSRGGDERDRKVRAKVEEWWRMVKSYLRLDSAAVEEERNRLLKIIENREETAAQDKAAGGADFIDQDLKYRMAVDLLNALTQYGGLISRKPGEIADKSEEIIAQLNGSRLDLENAREDEYIRTRLISSRLQKAMVNPKAQSERKKPNPNWLVRMFDSMMGVLEVRLRDLIRFSYGETRAKAEADLQDIEDAIALGSQTFNVYKVDQQREFDDIMKRIYGSAEKGVIRLTENLDDADRKAVTKQNVEAISRSWLLQRYVELEQTDDYAQNIAVNKRDGKWREEFDRVFKKYISDDDLTFLMWMRNWYRKNLTELNDKVLVPVSGIKQYSPGENYFPVKMLLPTRQGPETTARAWSPLPSWLTPRVYNNYDFDERTDLLTMWYKRMRESGASIAYARLGLNLSDILLNPSIKDTIRDNHGDTALRRLSEHITDIISGGAQPVEESDDSIAFADRLRAWQTNLTLSCNYISALKQMTSCPVYALRYDIDFGMVMRFMTDVDIGSVKELMASDGWKSRYGNGLSEAMQNAMKLNSTVSTGRTAKATNFLHHLYNSGFAVMEFGDSVPCVWCGQGLYRYFLAKLRDQEGGNATMSEEELKRKAMTRTWAVIEMTQQSKRTENLTAAQRGGPLGRFLYQFVSSPVQQLAYEVQAVREALAARGTPHAAEANKHLGRVLVVNHILMPNFLKLAAIIGGLPIGQVPNRDDVFWDFLISTLIGQYGCIFLAGAVGEGTLNALRTGKFNYRTQGLPVTGIIDLFQKLGIAAHDILVWNNEEFLDDVLKIMKSTGAPTRHLSNAIDNWGRGKNKKAIRSWTK